MQSLFNLSCYPHQPTVSAPKHRVATAKIRTLLHDGGVRIYLYYPHQKKDRGNRLGLSFGLSNKLAKLPNAVALEAGNVWRFAKQMTDGVRQDKLATLLAKSVQFVLLPALF